MKNDKTKNVSSVVVVCFLYYFCIFIFSIVISKAVTIAIRGIRRTAGVSRTNNGSNNFLKHKRNMKKQKMPKHEEKEMHNDRKIMDRLNEQ